MSDFLLQTHRRFIRRNPNSTLKYYRTAVDSTVDMVYCTAALSLASLQYRTMYVHPVHSLPTEFRQQSRMYIEDAPLVHF